MKPVQLVPVGAGSSGASVVDFDVAPVGPSSPTGAIAIIAGGLVVIGIAGFFELAAHSDAQKSATDITAKTAEITAQTTQLQAQITSKSGAVNDWSGTAQTVSAEVISTVAQRHGYTNFMRDLRNVVTPQLGIWLSSVDTGAAAGTDPSAGGSTVTIIGHAPSMAAIAALMVRLDATASMSDAKLGDFSSESTTKKLSYIKFTMTATLVGGGSGSTGIGAPTDGGTTVGTSTGGSDSSASEIALEPEPGFDRRAKAAAHKAKPKPLTPLELAIRAAGAVKGAS